MKSETKLFAAALCAVAVSVAHAGTTIWGEITFTDGSTQSVSNSVGNAACLAAGDLSPTTPGATPKKLALKSSLDGGGALLVDRIALSVTNDLEVVADGVNFVKAVGSNSVFTVTQTTGYETKFSGLAFEGIGQDVNKHAPLDGGAINLDGGKLVIDGCAFTNFVSRFSGGAVSARHLVEDSLVTNCVFSGNSAHPINGYGGAIHVSAASAVGTKTLEIVDSDFVYNVAENGGAINALAVFDVNECPMDLNVHGDVTFVGNSAVYEGGAIISEGGATVDGSNVVFSANFAGLTGGAICFTGITDEPLASTNVTVRRATFSDNIASNDVSWAAGGAISFLHPGYVVTMSDNVNFENNFAASGTADESAYGGAVYTAAGVTNAFSNVMFVSNRAENVSSSDVWCYGGAVSVEAGETTIDTCVFDCGVGASKYCMGNAIDFNGTDALVKNVTCRRGQAEAVSAYNGTLAVTNCVFVGNALADAAEEPYYDLYLDGSVNVQMAYSAYGSKTTSSGATVTESCTLTNCAADTVYAGDSLRLDGSSFNPVAGLGIVQTDDDFDGVAYGSKENGYSMGAYETNTILLTVTLYGEKRYDGNTTSAGCSWTWSSQTNDGEYAWSEIEPLDGSYILTNWVFGSAAVGSYSSESGTLTASVSNTSDRVTWLSTIVTNVFTGEITTNSSVVATLDPLEYSWTGAEIKPGKGVGTLTVMDEVNSIEIPASEYRLEWVNNVNPVACDGGTAPNTNTCACVIVVCTNNYAGTTFTVSFGITAYATEYYTSGALDSVVTNGTLSGSNVCASVDVPDGYCLDWQYSSTNAAAAAPFTTLTVLYETDVNVVGGDDIPDKYQKQVMFATANAKWEETDAGCNICKWVTLTNSTSGKWDADGLCILSSDVVPTVDKKYDNVTNVAWKINPVGQEITKSTFPIYVAEPLFGSLRDDSGRGNRSLALSGGSVDDYENSIAIVDFAIDDSVISGKVNAQMVDSTTGLAVFGLDMADANATLKILGAETLDGDWFEVGTVTADANGRWSLSRANTRRSLSATRTANGDRTMTLNVSSAAEPRFFKVQRVD